MNKVIIASAGSGKTTRIVRQAIKEPNERIAIVTYTVNNIQEIKNKFYEINQCIPINITITSWFSLLLKDFVRPYQNYLVNDRIKSIAFVEGRSARYIKKKDIRYFITPSNNVYTDKISEFGLICNQQSNGSVIERLRQVYDHIYIDEVQDLAGYDLEVIELLLNSNIKITLIGDNRQATYQTNSSPKNKKFAGFNIIEKFKLWEKAEKCKIHSLNDCYRSNQKICDFADEIYSECENTISKNETITGHDGVFFVKQKDVGKYTKLYNPKILRYDSRAKYPSCEGVPINWGDSKGLTFDRTLIIPNGPLKNYLKTGDIKYVSKSRAKLYVAITRAKHSVAFLFDDESYFKNITVASLVCSEKVKKIL